MIDRGRPGGVCRDAGGGLREISRNTSEVGLADSLHCKQGVAADGKRLARPLFVLRRWQGC